MSEKLRREQAKTKAKSTRAVIFSSGAEPACEIASQLPAIFKSIDSVDSVDELGALLQDQEMDILFMTMGPDTHRVLVALKTMPQAQRISVVLLARPSDDVEDIVACMDNGADDYIDCSAAPALFKAKIEASLNRRSRLVDALVNSVIPIGISLMAERDFGNLLDTVLEDAMTLCGADGGTLYLRTGDQKLDFVLIRNLSLGLSLGGQQEPPIPFKPIPLYLDHGKTPNSDYVAARVALSGETIALADVYRKDAPSLSGPKEYDRKLSYHTTSVLAVPLRDKDRHVIGVLQLINALDPETGAVAPFDEAQQKLAETLGFLAASALVSYVEWQKLTGELTELRLVIEQASQRRPGGAEAPSDYFQGLKANVDKLRS